MKTKMIKAVMLGLCLSAMTAGSAFAQSTAAVGAPVKGEAMSEETDALYAKQKEIDLYVFADHADEIASKGFEVNYTGVSDTYVEIGITPYTDRSADYLYGLFGKDIVRVVEAQDNTLYTVTTGSAGAAVSGAASGNTSSSTDIVSGGTEIVSGGGSSANSGTAGPDSAASSDSAQTVDSSKTDMSVPDVLTDKSGAAAPDTQTGNDGKVSIQIESLEGEESSAPAADDTEIVYQTTSETNPLADTDVQTISTKAEKPGERNSVPTALVIIAGGAVLAGGTVILMKKKNQ